MKFTEFMCKTGILSAISKGKIFFLLLLYSLFNLQSSAQTGTPYLRNYPPLEYNGHPQNWSIAQDKHGIIYIGNLSGILTYDGKKWKSIPIKHEVLIRSLAIDNNGRIYAGMNKDFGYLTPDSSGNLYYQSLIDKMGMKEKGITDVWKILVTSHGIYFQARERLIRWDGDTTRSWFPETEFHLAFNVRDWIYVKQSNLGLMQVLEDRIMMVGGGEVFADKIIYSMLPYKNTQILIGTKNNGLYLSNGIESVSFPTNADNFLMKNHHYCGVKLSNGDYALGTSRKGAVIIDEQGVIKSILNKSMGLQDENVYTLGVDNQNGLWLGLGNGVSRVEISSPLSVYKDATGLRGNVEAITYHQGKLFVATHQGLYCMNEKLVISNNENSEVEIFKPIAGLKTQVWSLVSIENEFDKNMLLFSTSDGIYYLTDNLASVYIREGTSMSIHRSRKDPSRVYVGLSNGFATIKYVNGKWVKEYERTDIHDNIHMIVEDASGFVWLGTKNNGVYRADLSPGFNNIQVEHLDTAQGLPAGRLNLFWVLNDVMFATTRGLYRYHGYKESKLPESGRKLFYPDSTLGIQFCDGSRNVFYMYEDNKGNVAINAGDENSIAVKQKDNSYQLEYIPFKRIPKAAIWAIYTQDNLTWWGGPDGLVLYNTKSSRNFNIKLKALIRNVSLNNDSLLSSGSYLDNKGQITILQPKHKEPNFHYNYNSLQFSFSTPSFDNEAANKFQYYLEGYDEKWSSWTYEAKKEYTNLSQGYYSFKVKAKNVYEEESDIAHYNFTILPPWYNSIWAYICYGFTFLGIIYVSVFLSAIKLRRAKTQLEHIVEQRTHEISLQNKKLEKNNIELEKLSLIASKTNNAVIVTDAEGNIEWVNESFTRISGYTLEDIQKTNTLQQLGANPKIKEIMKECCKTQKPARYESLNTIKSGNKIWTSSTLTPIIESNGQVNKLIIIDTDITERIKNEEIISQKNKDITDSLEYGKLIQETILPKRNKLQDMLKDSFIFFKPKDIVSGDFYWFSPLQQNGKQLYIIAAVDCTGHGVPGAFMSLIGNDLMNQLVLERKITQPDVILSTLNKAIKNALHQEEIDVEAKDGMDVALCCIDIENNKLEFAGAHRPLYVFRNSSNGIEQDTEDLVGEFIYEDKDKKAQRKKSVRELPDFVSTQTSHLTSNLLQIDGNKFGIGGITFLNKQQQFTNHKVSFQKGDVIYLFSDGYADQMGGEKRKKFMSWRLRQLLGSIHKLNMQEQVKKLNQEITAWQKENTQTDDIMIMGIRF